jgi:ATP-dependent DNA ligase
MQQVSDSGGGHLNYFAFDLLELDGETIAGLPLRKRKARLAALLRRPPAGISYSEHGEEDGEIFRRAACEHGLEGVVSKRVDLAYLPGDRGAWVKSKCLNRAEFVVVGWSDPEGSRPLMARCCSATTSGTAGCCTPAASERACHARRSKCQGDWWGASPPVFA